MIQGKLDLGTDSILLSRVNINFGLRVRATSGKKSGQGGEICFVSKYTPGFRVRFKDGIILRYTRMDHFIVLPGQ